MITKVCQYNLFILVINGVNSDPVHVLAD